MTFRSKLKYERDRNGKLGDRDHLSIDNNKRDTTCEVMDCSNSLSVFTNVIS